VGQRYHPRAILPASLSPRGYHDFALYWARALVSNIGSRMDAIATSWLLCRRGGPRAAHTLQTRLACATWLFIGLLLLGSPAFAETSLDPRFGIDEGLSDPATMAEMGAGWDRVLVPWFRIQPRGPDDFSGFGRALPEAAIRAEVARGVRVAGVLHYTPAWAARKAEDGLRAVPRDLDLPFDDPGSLLGRFVYETVRYFAGQIDDWLVWNEPDFRLGDLDSDAAVTWLGTDEDLAQLLKVAYLAAKQANPRATVSFPATTLWVDAGHNRPPLYARVLDILGRDPEAAAHGFYHDAVSVNVYHRPNEIPLVHALFKDIQRDRGLDKPVWLTETNAMPVDDRDAACWERHVNEPYPTTLREQAAFAVQALALASAVGYERIAFWRMIDGRACQQAGLWGAVRDDGSRRPVADALRTAIRAFAGFSRAQLSLTGPVYEVVLDKPSGQRVTALWNGQGASTSIELTRHGSRPRLVSISGVERPLDGDSWTIELAAATARFPGDPPGAYYIGGEPVLVVED
jgi:hypothetical protein